MLLKIGARLLQRAKLVLGPMLIPLRGDRKVVLLLRGKSDLWCDNRLAPVLRCSIEVERYLRCSRPYLLLLVHWRCINVGSLLLCEGLLLNSVLLCNELLHVIHWLLLEWIVHLSSSGV